LCVIVDTYLSRFQSVVVPTKNLDEAETDEGGGAGAESG